MMNNDALSWIKLCDARALDKDTISPLTCFVHQFKPFAPPRQLHLFVTVCSLLTFNVLKVLEAIIFEISIVYFVLKSRTAKCFPTKSHKHFLLCQEK